MGATLRALGIGVVVFAATMAHAETITVDANANRHPIDPRVYGTAFAPDSATLTDLNCPVHRHGGNTTSRYNWQQNCSNHAQDWYYESLDDGSSTAGASADSFIQIGKGAGADSLITIPMIGWVAKLGPGRGKLCSFSIAKYGAQQGNDSQWFPDAGNGVLTSGQNVTGNDPNDANVSVDSTFMKGWVTHLVNTWGTSQSGGVRYYILDNEHSIWQGTHRDVHPVGPTMDEIKTKMLDYGTMIKSVDPAALCVGPEEWGWSGYFYSGYDQQYGAAHGWSSLPDRAAHNNMDYMPWLLDQFRQNNASTGKRVLDVFSLHCYPQSGEYGTNDSASMQATRNRSTRQLWDTTYVDPSWINDKVMLIPRMKNWVTQYYPGTQVAITEYNWGDEAHINGATAQADIFGIFGREGLDMATRWTTPDASTPTYKAMKMYRNYDGNKSTFGDQSVSATVTNPDNLSAFAAVRSKDGALTVMVINKVTTTAGVTINLQNFANKGTASAWQLTSTNTITSLAPLTFSANALTASVPGQSITLFVLPPAAGNQPPNIVSAPTASPNPGQVSQNVSFNASASDPNNDPLTYKWDFGDGTNGTGASTSHTYSSVGVYSVKLTVLDPGGLSANGALSLVINAASNGGSTGTGTGTSTGTGSGTGSGTGVGTGTGTGSGTGGGGSSGTTITMTVSKLQGSTNFKSANRDSVSLTGTLPSVPAGFAPNGQSLTLNVGGAVQTFTLDAHGRGKGAHGTIALKIKLTGKGKAKSFAGGDVPFTAKLQKGSWASAWGINPQTTISALPMTLSATIQLGVVTYQATVTATYSGKAGASGRFKK